MLTTTLHRIKLYGVKKIPRRLSEGGWFNEDKALGEKLRTDLLLSQSRVTDRRPFSVF
jgi:hypothetical protein